MTVCFWPFGDAGCLSGGDRNPAELLTKPRGYGMAPEALQEARGLRTNVKANIAGKMSTEADGRCLKTFLMTRSENNLQVFEMTFWPFYPPVSHSRKENRQLPISKGGCRLM